MTTLTKSKPGHCHVCAAEFGVRWWQDVPVDGKRPGQDLCPGCHDAWLLRCASENATTLEAAETMQTDPDRVDSVLP